MGAEVPIGNGREEAAVMAAPVDVSARSEGFWMGG
jgi:hypothetical protein